MQLNEFILFRECAVQGEGFSIESKFRISVESKKTTTTTAKDYIQIENIQTQIGENKK